MSDNLPEQVYSRPGAAVAVRQDEDELGVADILIPRMKIGQKTSRDVLDYGGVYVLQSRDDMEPVQIAAPPAKGQELGEAVRFYVHGSPTKGWSWKPAQEGGDWRGREYPDLRIVRDQDPRNVRRTYDYLITVVGFERLPVSFILHGQFGGQASKTINTEILLARGMGVEPHTIAFKLQARKTSSPKDGQERPFIQAVVSLDKVPAKDREADMETVERHHQLVQALRREQRLQTVQDDAGQAGNGASAPDAPPLD